MHVTSWKTLLVVGGLFDALKRNKGSAARPAERTVKLEMPATSAPPAPPPAATTEGSMHPLRRDLRFKGLHADVDPTPNVRGAEMTCPNCERKIRYVLNSNGAATTIRCPGCARSYRA